MNMKYRNMIRKYYAPVGGEGDSGGEGGGSGEAEKGDSDKTYTQAELDEIVSGLKSKNGELINKQKEAKKAAQEAQEHLKQFEGIDPDTVKSIIKRFSDDEEAELIKAGKVDEVLNKRTERMQQAHEKEVAKYKAELEKANKRAEKFTDRVLADEIRAAGSETGIHKSAYDDAIYRAKGAFEVNEDGEIVAKEGVLDSSGKPLTPKAWFEDMKEKAPHWFPAPQGGGLGNNAGGRVSKGNPGGTKEEREAYYKAKFNLQD
ncbi:hypothetical protein KRX19_05590 [Cardiobacteriaceae bacterium TAE3-ERU3]|nr:hypothetical protein [Cardiobacteriaceae bacterium TAE3-ERU3]